MLHNISISDSYILRKNYPITTLKPNKGTTKKTIELMTRLLHPLVGDIEALVNNRSSSLRLTTNGVRTIGESIIVTKTASTD